MSEPLDLEPLKRYYGALLAEYQTRPELRDHPPPFYVPQIMSLIAEVERLRAQIGHSSHAQGLLIKEEIRRITERRGLD